jgi:hypothetical protein
MSLHHVADIASSAPALLEAAMLLCFGVAWPVANLRMLRVRRSEGKGLGFTLMILCGYLAGASAKLVMAAHGAVLAPLFWLYMLNAGSVAVNIALQWRFGRQSVRNRLSAVSMVS